MSKQRLMVDSQALQGALALGFIPLDIVNAVIIAANVVQNTTEGGRPDGNTAPTLQRINQDTDKALRVTWAAGSVAELQFPPIPLPPDLDDAAPITVHLILGKDANANTFNVDVQAFFNAGDAECGAATENIAQARAEYSVEIAAADVPAHPGVLNISLVPAAHAGDALFMDGAWIEYTRKA